MRIVIFSLNFPPLRNPRSFRVVRYVSELWKDRKLIVITAPVDLPHEKSDTIHRVGMQVKQMDQIRIALKTKSWIRLLHKIILPDDKIFHQLYFIVNYLFKWRKKDDLIITVSNPFSSHLCGYFLKLIWNHKWIADIGDCYSSVTVTQNKFTLVEKAKRKFEKNILHYCDSVVLNSASMQFYYNTTFEIPEKKMYVIPNGCSINFNNLKNIDSDFIRLSYIGNTYPLVREGIKEVKILLKIIVNNPDLKIRIQLFGSQFHGLINLAMEFPDLIIINYCGSDIELEKAYSSTDVLINVANFNSPGLPSKLEEYKLSGLPVINFINSEEDPSFLFLAKEDDRIKNIYLNEVNDESLISFISNYKTNRRMPEMGSREDIRSAWMELILNCER